VALFYIHEQVWSRIGWGVNPEAPQPVAVADPQAVG
jgi:uncharacterized membrane protein